MNLVFLLEEPSARDLLEGLLPRLIPKEIEVRFVVFEGKSDLEKYVVRRIRGWLASDTHFVILRDQDSADCRTVKARLSGLATTAGRPDTLVRVACRELESWAIGDWPAVAEAFGKPKLVENQRKAPYRDPDRLGCPVDELRKFIPEYQKRDGARRLGRLLDPDRSQSKSFIAFCTGVKRLVSSAAGGC